MSRTISTATTGPVILNPTNDNPLYITSTRTVTSAGDGVDGPVGTTWTIHKYLDWSRTTGRHRRVARRPRHHREHRYHFRARTPSCSTGKRHQQRRRLALGRWSGRDRRGWGLHRHRHGNRDKSAAPSARAAQAAPGSFSEMAASSRTTRPARSRAMDLEPRHRRRGSPSRTVGSISGSDGIAPCQRW